jgi:hypothetical protein
MLDNITRKQTTKEIDRINFWHIFLAWTVLVVTFGLIYFFFASQHGSLRYTSNGARVANVWDTVYFSFVSATTTGFGDIVPTGAFKVIAVIEVVMGLILLAAVTSKLVSLKQDAIMSEIYHLSLRERINRFRDNLLLYRQHLSDMMAKVEDGSIRTREVNEMYHFISQFDDTLREVMTLLQRSDRNRYAKDMDAVDMELLANSVITSYERSHQLLSLLDEEGFDWRRDVTVEVFKSCLDRGRDVFEKILDTDGLSQSSQAALRDNFEDAIASLQSVVHRDA